MKIHHGILPIPTPIHRQAAMQAHKEGTHIWCVMVYDDDNDDDDDDDDDLNTTAKNT